MDINSSHLREFLERERTIFANSEKHMKININPIPERKKRGL